MRIGKKLISLALCLIILIGTVAIGSNGINELFNTLTIKASAENYSVGDTIYFGTYPQSDVTDSLGSILNNLDGTWISYNYYTGTYTPGGDSLSAIDDGKMVPSNYMSYKDVYYEGDKYRAVYFETYRPPVTGFKSLETSENSTQFKNGYYVQTTYWFKFEPIEWRVLDPSNGLVMCENLIDSQPFQNYISYNFSDKKRYNNNGHYANDWETSSLRAWLNNEFYDTAFSDRQKINVSATTNINNCNWNELYNGATTIDNVFLISYDEALEGNYGFISNYATWDSAKRHKGTDYAKCQGLQKDYNSYYEANGNSSWWLRTPIYDGYSCCVYPAGGPSDIAYVGATQVGVCPAMRLQNLKSDIESTYFSFHCPNKVYSKEFEAYGVATPDSTITIYDGDQYLCETVTNADGKWNTMVSLNNPMDSSEHSITATFSYNGQKISQSKTILFDTNIFYPEKFFSYS